MLNRHWRKTLLIGLVVLSLTPAVPLRAELPRVTFSAKPAHAVLFVIDGISYKVWDKVDLPTLAAMARTGARVRQVFLPPAAHPHQGPYARLHTCSIPNPILMSGTLFIDENTVYFNQQFFPKLTTAFISNALDYQTLIRCYNYIYQKVGTDEEALRMALEFERLGQPAFLSVHLQDTGEGGSEVMMTRENVPWKDDIWHPQSPYRRNLLKADQLLGDFIAGLAKLGLLETTAILVVGDHGQADTGWHPLELWDPSITTSVLWGAGVNAGAVLDYGELIDVGPTICALMGVGAPSTALGVPWEGALRGARAVSEARPRFQEKMNTDFRKFRKVQAAALAVLEATDSPDKGRLYTRYDSIVRRFYGIERFIEWPRFKTVAELVEQNDKALKDLEDFAIQLKASTAK